MGVKRSGTLSRTVFWGAPRPAPPLRSPALSPATMPCLTVKDAYGAAARSLRAP